MICQRLTDSPFTGHAWGNILSVKDANGNPLTYRDSMTMTWQNGRQLATLVNGNKTMSYTYGADSLRTTKLLNSTLHTYEYVGGQLLYETRGAKKIHYVYDSTGNVLAAARQSTRQNTNYAAKEISRALSTLNGKYCNVLLVTFFRMLLGSSFQNVVRAIDYYANEN